MVLALILAQACDPQGEFVCRGGDQTIADHKSFYSLSQHFASYDVGGVGCGVYSPNGVATRHLVAPTNGDALILRSRRHAGDYAGGVVIEQERWRGDGGAYTLAINAPRPCDVPVHLFTERGDFLFGQAMEPGEGGVCKESGAGELVDISGISGHVALRRGQPGHYLAVRAAMGANVWAVNADGSEPVCDGGRWTFSYDGGCRYHAASGHGGFDVGDGYPRWQGQLLELNNPRTGTRSDHVAYFSANGGYWQNHGLTLATFPPPGTTVDTNQGTFFVDAAPGEQLFDRQSRSWYHMKPGEDAGWVIGHGAGWTKFAEQPSIDALLSTVALLEARVAALEAACQ